MTDWKAWKMVRAFGSLVCGVTRKHPYSRAYVPDETAPDVKEKRCTRCGEVKPVKRRKAK